KRRAPLTPPVALTALTDVNVELPVNGLARDLDLELLGHVRFVERSAAVGTDRGQRRFVDLVDLLGGGRLAVGGSAVVLARFAAGFLGVRFRFALCEGAGLALARPTGGIELAAQALVLGLQVIDPSLKSSAVGAPNRFHGSIIHSWRKCRCGTRHRRMDQLELEALIKYHLPCLPRECILDVP